MVSTATTPITHKKIPCPRARAPGSPEPTFGGGGVYLAVQHVTARSDFLFISDPFAAACHETRRQTIRHQAVAGLKVSPDNTILAFAEDTLGRRKYTIRFKNLATGEMRKETIANTTGSVVWANDNKTLYYTVKDAALRAYKIMQYQLGSEEHKEIYHEKDTTFSTWVYKSKSQRFIIIGSYSTLSQEYRVMDANKPGSEFHIIQPRKRNLEYSIAHYGDKFYILTNHEAQNFRLMSTPLDKTTMENWSEVIAHRKEVLLENIEIFADYLVVQERKDGLTHLHIVPWDQKQKDYFIDFGEETYTVGLDVNFSGFVRLTC